MGREDGKRSGSPETEQKEDEERRKWAENSGRIAPPSIVVDGDENHKQSGHKSLSYFSLYFHNYF